MADHWIKRGDTAPFIRSTLLDYAGDPVDIAGAYVTFIMRGIRGDVVVEAPASNDQVDLGQDGSKGYVSYEWLSGDTDTEGGYYAEWEVDFLSGERETFPNDGHITVAIVTDLGDGS